MTIIPINNVVIVPGISLFFKTEYFEKLTDTQPEVGQEVVFAFLKEDKKREEIVPEDIYPIGVEGKVKEVADDGYVSITTSIRVNIEDIRITEDGNVEMEITEREDVQDISEEAIKEKTKKCKAKVLKLIQGLQWGGMVQRYVMQWKSIGEITTALTNHLLMGPEEKYHIIETDSLAERTELMENALYETLEMFQVSSEAESAQEASNEKLYREAAIRKQMDYLQKELDEMHPENMSDIRKFEEKIQECGMNETARTEAEKVLNRMKQEGENSNEYGMLYDYLDFVTGLKWNCEEHEEISLEKSKEILEEDHFGLKKVKERILQQIAVMNLNHKQSGSILLFVGAPGTGKTSIGQSVAKAMGRSYVRVSLGGVRDEAEIRGHRRTYIGAMPGRIMDGIMKSKAANPVMVLDEIDKLSGDFRGDPSSALLEVLDPEQNSTFTDHYMNVPYDLSNVLFICTANSTDTIPEPLLNRMEVIHFQGYTASDKFQIAKKHLLPKAMANMGIKKSVLKVSEDAIREIISDYTMEGGVRGLKKRFDTLCRVAAVKIVSGEQKSITVTPKKLQEYLDMKPIRHDNVTEQKKPGIVTGLAWTAAGGDILFIETLFIKGSGKVIITGQLGDVMKESVQIAVSLVKAMFPEHSETFEKNDLHIHVPEGAVPKDGPSAGITLTTAIASLVTGNPVSPEIAMTGEVSLQGRVMPIGGLPEKLMAAVRAGVKTVFLPKENERDLDEVADEVKEQLTIIFVTEVNEVLRKTKVYAENKKRNARK